MSFKLTTKDINSYQLKGYHKINKFLKKNQINNIFKAYYRFVKNKKELTKKNYGKIFSYLKDKNKPSSLHNLQNYKNLFFYKIARNKKLNLAADRLLGKKSKILNIQFFIKNAGQNLPTTIHQDNAYWCFKNYKALSFWIALKKTNKKNGCLYYYEKSHIKDVKHYKNEYVPGTTFCCKPPKTGKIKYYSLNAGDCVVHDSRSIHGSFKNLSNSNRVGFILSYVEKKAKKNALMLKVYKKNYNLVKKLNIKKYN